MATKTFTGAANDGDWSNAANWSPGVPTSGNDVVVSNIGQDITAGHTAYSAVNPASFTVTQGYTGRLGSNSASIQFGTITTLRYAGGGEYGKVNATVTTAHLDHTGDGTFFIADGTWTTVNCSGGKVEKDGAATVTTLNNAGAAFIAYKGNAFTTIYNGAGSLTTYEDFGTCYNSGTLTVKDTATPSTVTTSVRVTTWSGGKTFWHSSGLIPTMETYPRGLFSVSGTEKTGFTITTHTEWRGATVNLFAPGVVVTESAKVVIGVPIEGP